MSPDNDSRSTASSRALLRPGQEPLVDTVNGPMERWRADALLLGETSAAIQARHDAVTTLDDIEQQKRELTAGQAALAIEPATFDAERRAFADQAATLAGRLSVEWDRFQKIKADQEREPEEPLEILPEEWRSAEPEPPLALEGDNISGTSPGNASPGEPSEASAEAGAEKASGYKQHLRRAFAAERCYPFHRGQILRTRRS